MGAHPEGLPHLMNNGPEGYKLVMRRENPDPEDCESVLDEEGYLNALTGFRRRAGIPFEKWHCARRQRLAAIPLLTESVRSGIIDCVKTRGRSVSAPPGGKQTM